jgi:predicted RNA-binding protein with TRAM domain
MVSGAVFVVPIALSIVAATVTGHLLPRPRTTGGLAGWWIVVLGVPLVVLFATDRLARRALPLAVLLKMSMVFPDRAPKRLAVARRSGTTRNLARRVEEARTRGVEDEPVVAAEKILALAGALNAHDRLTRGHGERVRVLTDLIADELDLPTGERDRLRWSSLLHDIGKLAVHPYILNKPAKLDDDEWNIIKNHPLEGAKLTAPLAGWLGEWANTIAEHHERYDGTGYPHGLRGDEISLGGRIVAVADCYDTMTSVRSYKMAMSPKAARAELAVGAGSQFDPRVVRAFLDISIGRLQPVAGPLAWLGSLPFIGSIPQLGQAAVVLGRLGAASLVVTGAVAAGTANAAAHASVTPSLGQVASPFGEKPLGPGGGGPGSSTISGPARPDGSSDGGAGAATLAGSPLTVPSAPTIGSATAGNGSISVAFEWPGSNGNSLILTYTATCVSPTGGAAGSMSGPGTPIVVLGLTNGNPYSCTVAATDAVGTGAASIPSDPVIVGSPAAPTAVKVVSQSTTTATGSLTVKFRIGANNGSPITSQTATCASTDGGPTESGSHSGAMAAPITVDGVATGDTYTCTVTATNAAGAGAASTASDPVIVGSPAAPTAVKAVSQSTTTTTGSLTVKFAIGADNGSAITNQTATCVSSNGGPTGTGSNAGPTAAPITVDGVATGDTYTCTVTATNAAGAGAASTASDPVIVGSPAAPTAVKAVSQSTTTTTGSLTVKFAIGADNGSAITNQTATCVSSNGGPTETGSNAGPTAAPITVDGVTTGDAYTCTVAATNIRGGGLESVPSLPVIVGSPAAPTGVTAAPVGSGEIEVSFTPGANNGSPMTSYTASCASSNGGVVGATSGAASPLIVMGLTAGDTYTCRVTAANTRGTSLTSDASAAVTA